MNKLWEQTVPGHSFRTSVKLFEQVWVIIKQEQTLWQLNWRRVEPCLGVFSFLFFLAVTKFWTIPSAFSYNELAEHLPNLLKKKLMHAVQVITLLGERDRWRERDAREPSIHRSYLSIDVMRLMNVSSAPLLVSYRVVFQSRRRPEGGCASISACLAKF